MVKGEGSVTGCNSGEHSTNRLTIRMSSLHSTLWLNNIGSALTSFFTH